MSHSWNFHKGKRKDAKTTEVKEKDAMRYLEFSEYLMAFF